jgi:Fe-S-cluster containining protein
MLLKSAKIPREKLFYAGGLRFSCICCSDCCRLEPGMVFLRKKDVERLVYQLKMGYVDFIETFCRWVPSGCGREQLSLKEKSNYDCIFWKEGCTVYEARPLQCSTYPFWPSILASEKTWNSTICPGMGKGKMHCFKEIESALLLQEAEPITSRFQESGEEDL